MPFLALLTRIFLLLLLTFPAALHLLPPPPPGLVGRRRRRSRHGDASREGPRRTQAVQDIRGERRLWIPKVCNAKKLDRKEMGGEESCPMPILGSSNKTIFIFLIACRSFINFEAEKNPICLLTAFPILCVLRPLSDLSRRFDIGRFLDLAGKGMYLATYFICRQIGWERHRRKGCLRD